MSIFPSTRGWSFRRHGPWPLLFVLAAAVLFWPVLAHIREVVVGAPATPFVDALRIFYPQRTFANGEMQQGRLPLWNPYLLCGYSLHGEGQAGLFYPLNLLLSPLAAQVALNLSALVHFAAAGIFFCLYLEACGLRRFSAVFGGFIYLFSSGPLSRLFPGHFCMLPFLVFVPALLWAWESWRTTGARSMAAWAGVFIGCMGLAGYPQLLLYGCMYLGCHLLLECARRLRQGLGTTALAPVVYFLVAVALGAALCAVQLMPSYAFGRESFRRHESYEAVASFSFPPENLLTLLLPRFFGDLGEGTAPYWGRNLLWESWIYVGIVPLALAVLAIVRVRKPVVIMHGLAIPFCLAVALGKHTPVHRFLFDFFPLFSNFRGSSKFSFFALVSLVSLAAFGADHLLGEADSKEERRCRVAMGTTLACFAALGVGLGILLGLGHAAQDSILSRLVRWSLARGETYLPYYFSHDPDLSLIWRQAFPELVRLVAVALTGLAVAVSWRSLKQKPRLACAALCLAVFPDLLHFSTKEFVTAPIDASAVSPEFVRNLKQDKSRTRVLAPALERNSFLPYRLESPLGYVGNLTERYNNFMTAVNGVDRSSPMIDTPILRLTPQLLWPAVSSLVLNLDDDLAPEIGTPVVRQGDQVLYRLRQVHPRAAFAREVRVFTSAEAALLRLESGSVDLFSVDLLEIPEGRNWPAFSPAAPDDTVDIVESFPAKVVVRTRATGSRLLVLADSFVSGWRCRLEGGEALEIYPVNVAFRGVVVPAGVHTVTFSYEPTSFYAGAAVSVVTILALGIGTGVLAVLRRRGSGLKLDDV